MKTPTDEQVFEALGWTQRDGYWFEPFGSRPIKVPPDIRNDLNAVSKHIWPELEKSYGIGDGNFKQVERLSNLLMFSYQSDTPASALVDAFWAMKEEEKSC